MNIRAHRLQIARAGRLDRRRLVAALEQMPVDLVPPVETLRVSALQPFHARDQISFWRLGQKVIMIAHQHVGMDAPAGLVASLAQGLQKALPIPVVVEIWRGLDCPGP